MNVTSYYFRKLAQFVQPREYHHVKVLRTRTNPQISLDELLFLRWGIRYFRPQTLVEIGSFCGASTSIMADAVKTLGRGRLYAVDLFTQSGGGKGHAGTYWTTFDQTMQPYRGWFEKIEGDATTIQWDRPIDMLFIDGDHSETGVSADIEKYTPFIRLGGALPARL